MELKNHQSGAVTFTNSEGEVIIPRIWWERDAEKPGILHATYRDLKLMIRPIGCTEYDGLIDGVIWCGTDDLEELEKRLIDIADGVYVSEKTTI